jgi:hypothetical protein
LEDSILKIRKNERQPACFTISFDNGERRTGPQSRGNLPIVTGDFPNPRSVDFFWSAGLRLPDLRQEFISSGKTGGSARPGFSRFVKMGAITQNVGIGMHDGIAIIRPQR